MCHDDGFRSCDGPYFTGDFDIVGEIIGEHVIEREMAADTVDILDIDNLLFGFR